MLSTSYKSGEPERLGFYGLQTPGFVSPLLLPCTVLEENLTALPHSSIMRFRKNLSLALTGCGKTRLWFRDGLSGPVPESISIGQPIETKEGVPDSGLAGEVRAPEWRRFSIFPQPAKTWICHSCSSSLFSRNVNLSRSFSGSRCPKSRNPAVKPSLLPDIRGARPDPSEILCLLNRLVPRNVDHGDAH
jgi:hypothetical protein